MNLHTLYAASALWLVASTTTSATPVQQAARISPSASIAARVTQAAESRDSIVPAFLSVDPLELDHDALTSLGASVRLVAGDIMTVRVPTSALSALSEVAGVKYVQTSSSVSRHLDKAIPDVGADLVKSGSDLPGAYTGRGVVIGIVDAGFDYNHAAFRDSEGNLRIKRVWEQTTVPSAGMNSPAKYGYGVELTTPEEITTASGDIRNNTHGTHVAGIAAGSDPAYDGAFRGAAPDADLVLVSMDSDSDGNVAVAEGVAYIFDYADQVGLPCVVNLSLGTHAGPHDGSSSFDRLIDSLQGAGRLIVGSAGNDRAAHFHVTHTFESDTDLPLRTFVDYLKAVNSVNAGGIIELWASPSQDIEVALTVVNTRTGDVAERVVVYPAAEDVSDVSLGRNVTGSFTVAAESANPLNGKPHIVMTSAVTAIRTNYAIAIEVTPGSAGQVDIWADNVHMGLSGKGVEGYCDANGSTIAELGGTSRRILTVGSYTTRNAYTLYGETTVNTLDETVGAISSFSNYGPTADGRLKPQVTAPGCYIISAVSANAVSVNPLSHSYEQDGRWMSYGYMQGTSMSSPLVAGVVATWLQACPDLTPEQLAAVIQSTSRSDEHTGDISSGSYDWGWGKLDAMAGLRGCLELAGTGSMADTGLPAGLVALVGDEIRVVSDSGLSDAALHLYNTMGTVVMSTPLGNVSVGHVASVSLSDLPHGIYIVELSTPSGSSTLKIAR